MAARSDDRGIAKLDMLGGERHGAKARTTNLIDAPGGAFDGKAGADMRLAGRILALTGSQHLTEDCLADFSLFNAGAGNHGLKNSSAKLMCGGIGKSAGEAAHGGAGRRGDNDVGHAEILSYPSQGGRAS